MSSLGPVSLMGAGAMGLGSDLIDRGCSLLPNFVRSFFSSDPPPEPALDEHDYVYCEPVVKEREQKTSNVAHKAAIFTRDTNFDPNLELVQRAVKVDKQGKTILSEAESKWIVAGPSAEFNYVMGDIPALFRQVCNLSYLIKHQTPASGLHGLGMMSAVSVLTGYDGICRGHLQTEISKKIKDCWGKIFGRVSMVRGAMEALGGIVIVPVRLLSLAAARTGAKTAAHAATVLGRVGTALFGGVYFLHAVPSTLALVRGIKFNSALNKVMKEHLDKPEAEQLKMTMQFLQSELSLTRADRKALAAKVMHDPNIWNGNYVSEVELDPDDIKLLSQYDHDYATGFVNYLSDGNDEVTKVKLENHVKEAFIQAMKLKEVQLGRKSDPETVKLIKEEMQKPKSLQLVSRLDGSDSDAIDKAKDLIDQVKANTKSNLRFNYAIGFFTLLGALAFLLGSVATGGVLPIAVAIMWAVLAVALTGVDVYTLMQAWKTSDPSYKDKIFMCLGSFLMGLSVILGTVFSGGLAPMIASIVSGVMASGVSGYSYYKWGRHSSEKSSDENEPLLDEKEKLA